MISVHVVAQDGQVTVNGRPVRNKVARSAIVYGSACVAAIGLVLSIMAFVIGVGLLVVLSPLLLVVHSILRRTGREGFVEHQVEGDKISNAISVSPAAFHRR